MNQLSAISIQSKIHRQLKLNQNQSVVWIFENGVKMTLKWHKNDIVGHFNCDLNRIYGLNVMKMTQKWQLPISITIHLRIDCLKITQKWPKNDIGVILNVILNYIFSAECLKMTQKWHQNDIGVILTAVSNCIFYTECLKMTPKWHQNDTKMTLASF